MKKHILFLAGSALILASCGSNDNKNQEQTKAQMDSAVNAQVAQHDAMNAAKNDSALRAIEAEKAAAMTKEHEVTTNTTHKHTAGKTKEHEATPPPPPPPPATIGNGKPSMEKKDNSNSNQNTIGNGKPVIK